MKVVIAPCICRLCASLYCLKMENTQVEFVIHETVIECLDESVVLVLIDPKTHFCHGYEEFFTDHNVPKLRKRAKNVTVKKRKFNCSYCEYSTKEKYMVTRHVARIHEKTVANKLCSCCHFSTIYASNLKRHIHRAHSSKISSNSSNQAISDCNQAIFSDCNKVFSGSSY